MLTPSFNLSQTDEFVTFIIKAPFSKIDEADILIEDNEFKFYSKPYYLRLTLPGNLIEDGRENAKYDVDISSFIINIPKAEKGEHFEGLSMLTKLLAPKGSSNIKSPLIEVIDSHVNENVPNDDSSEDECDWHIEQDVPHDDINIEGPFYGFANQRSGEFKKMREEFADVIDLIQPDKTPLHKRRILRHEDELSKFSDEHYLADLYENEIITEILSYKTNWNKDFVNSKDVNIALKFTEHENEKMRNLPKKEYLLDRQNMQSVYLSLVDILYAYAYNHRTTFGENTVESGWTICKLSSTLSWMDSYTSINDVIKSCFCRSLCYPLYRHWKLNKKVWKDTCELLSLGKEWILRCFLEIHDILIKTESHYILNNLYITDYCVWIQSMKNKHIKTLFKEMLNVSIKKDDLNLDLVELQLGAKLAIEEIDLIKTVESITELSLTDSNHPSFNSNKKYDDISNTSDKKSEIEELDLIKTVDSIKELSITDSNHPSLNSEVKSDDIRNKSDKKSEIKIDSNVISKESIETDNSNCSSSESSSCESSSSESSSSEDDYNENDCKKNA